MVFDVLLQEFVDELLHRRWMQVAVDSILLFLVPIIGLDQISIARVLRDILVAFIAVIIFGLLDQH
jgi:uncharacterized membrane protein YhaH (DUF805 family)